MGDKLIDSAIFIRKLEMVSELLMCYHWAEKHYGENFEEAMTITCEEITSLQRLCKKGTSFFEATYLMIVTPLEDEDGELEEDKSKDTIMMIKACLAWTAFKVWDLRYDSLSMGVDETDRLVATLWRI